MQELDERPPYVRFEQRPIEDRQKTKETGIVHYKDRIYALITPAGSKDVHEEIAEKWIQKQEENARNGRIPPQHLDYYKRAYKDYLEGVETPDDGIPIKHCPIFTAAQVKQILAVNVRTVEDLAQAPENVLERIGMGARPLQQKARNYLESGDQGKAAQKIQELETALDKSEKAREKQAAQIEEMADRLSVLEGQTKKKRGRPPKKEAA